LKKKSTAALYLPDHSHKANSISRTHCAGSCLFFGGGGQLHNDDCQDTGARLCSLTGRSNDVSAGK